MAIPVTSAWAVVVLLAMGTFLIRAAGPMLLGERQLSPFLAATSTLLLPALLAALLLQQTFVDEHSLTLDARVVGLIAAMAALLLRMPLLWVLVVAAAGTAVFRMVV